MYTITVWNTDSTNFDANAFVREYGTGSIQFKSKDAAHQWMARVIDGQKIIKVKLVGPKGSIIWTRHGIAAYYPVTNKSTLGANVRSSSTK